MPRPKQQGPQGEKHCSHCGSNHTSGFWRWHPTSGQRLCHACFWYANRNGGKLPPDSVLQRRPALPRRLADVRRDMAQRRCLRCGSSSPGKGNGAAWKRHPATGEEWLCSSCYSTAHKQLKKHQLPVDDTQVEQAQRSGVERQVGASSPSSPGGPAAAARKRARGEQRREGRLQEQGQQEQQAPQEAPTAAASGGNAAPEPASKRRRKQARPHRQPPSDAQPAGVGMPASAGLLADAVNDAVEGPPASAGAAEGRGAPSVPSPVEQQAQPPLTSAAEREAPPGPAAGPRQQAAQLQEEHEAEADLYSLLQEAAEQAAAAASGLTAELAAAVAAALPLEPKKEAYLRRLLLRYQYSAAAVFASTLLQLAGVRLPPVS